MKVNIVMGLERGEGIVDEVFADEDKAEKRKEKLNKIPSILDVDLSEIEDKLDELGLEKDGKKSYGEYEWVVKTKRVIE